MNLLHLLGKYSSLPCPYDQIIHKLTLKSLLSSTSYQLLYTLFFLPLQSNIAITVHLLSQQLILLPYLKHLPCPYLQLMTNHLDLPFTISHLLFQPLIPLLHFSHPLPIYLPHLPHLLSQLPLPIIHHPKPLQLLHNLHLLLQHI